MKILIAGDFVPFGRVADTINSGNFSCFDQVKSLVSGMDYSIVNFECPVVEHKAEAIQKVGPSIKCSANGVDAIKRAGFKCVTLANNHMNDYGSVGINDTILTLKERCLDYVGAGSNLEAASKILYKKIGGKLLGIINCCEHEFSIATNNTHGCNPLDPINQFNCIKQAKSIADYVIVIVHGGHEGYQLPSPRMQRTYRFFIDAGADAVLNHHQHCYSGFEIYNEKPIFYGLGNFCFDTLFKKTAKSWYEGYMVVLDLSNNRVGYSIIPYNQCDDKPRINILESNAFDEKLKELNAIINSPSDLESHFLNLIKTRGCEALVNTFSPFGNRYISGLIKRGIIPSFITKKKLLKAYPYLNCESHRDILHEKIIDVLNN